MKKYEYEFFATGGMDADDLQKLIVERGFYGWQLHAVQAVPGKLTFWRESNL